MLKGNEAAALWEHWFQPHAAACVDGEIVFSGECREGGGWQVGTSVPLSGTSDDWEKACRRMNSWHAAYFSAAVISRKRERRGKKADVLLLPGVWLDIDCAEGAHKPIKDALPFPTKVEGEELARSLATRLKSEMLLVDSGGGFHGYLPFSRGDAPLKAAIEDLLAAWQSVADDHFRQAGRHLDAKVSGDPVRVLRLPGSQNRKSEIQLPVRVVQVPGSQATLTPDAILALARSSGVTRSPRAAVQPKNGRSGLPGQKLDMAVPVSVLLEALGWEPLGEPERCEWRVPGSSRSRHQATTYLDAPDEPGTVTVFSTTAQAELKSPESSYRGTFSALGGLVCSGDYHLARRVAERVVEDEDPAQRLVSILETAQLAVDAGAQPTLKDAVAEIADQCSMPAPGTSEVTLGVATPIVAVLSGPGMGLYELRRDSTTGALVRELFAPWIAWISREVRPAQLDGDGRIVPAPGSEPCLTVVVETRDGRSGTVECAADDIERPALVLRRAIRGLELPASPRHRFLMANALDLLGQVTGRTEQVTRLSSHGWADTPDGPAFLASGGSVAGSGPVTIAEVSRSDGGRDPAWVNVGWPEAPLPAELGDRDWESIARWLEMLPGRPEVCAALLGAIFAAPLRLPSARPAILLTAPPGVGKSALLRRVALWQSPGASLLHLPGATDAGVRAWTRWFRDSMLCADDFRLPPGRAGEAAERVLETLAQAAYDGSVASKAARDGARRSDGFVSPSLVLTGEAPPTASAAVQRLLVVRLGADDVPLGLGSPLDEWSERHAVGARRVFGAYLRWLATEHASPADLSQHSDERRRQVYHAGGDSRAAEQVAAVACGLDSLRRFTAAAGRPDPVPMQGAGSLLLRLASAEHESADVVAVTLRTLQEMLDGGLGHLVRPNGDWAAGAWRHAPAAPSGRAPDGTRLGWLLPDGGVWMPAAAVQCALVRSRREGEQSACRIGLGARFGAFSRAPSSLRLPRRPEGWLLPPGALGSDDDDEEAPLD